eukprot:3926138-Rhodomonas_salina.2
MMCTPSSRVHRTEAKCDIEKATRGETPVARECLLRRYHFQDRAWIVGAKGDVAWRSDGRQVRLQPCGRLLPAQNAITSGRSAREDHHVRVLQQLLSGVG